MTEEDEIKFSLCPHVDIQTTDNLSLQTINLLRREKNRSNLDFVIGVVLVSCHGPFFINSYSVLEIVALRSIQIVTAIVDRFMASLVKFASL